MRKTIIRITALLAFGPLTASADLIFGSCDTSAGIDGSITCDTATGLEWLDLTATQGLSVNEFLAGAGGWSTQGWLLGSESLVLDLFSRVSDDVNGGNILRSRLGTTQCRRVFSVTICDGDGWLSTSTPEFYKRGIYSTAFSSSGSDGGYSISGSGTGSTKFTSVGVWAYRPPLVVPEPGTLALLAVGIVGVGLARGWKKAH